MHSLSLSRSYTAHNLLLLLAVTLFTAYHSVAQNCPPGFVSEAKVLTYPYNGGCCSLRVEYCKRVVVDPITNLMTEFQLKMGSIEFLDPTGPCWSFDPTQPPPLDHPAIVNHVRKSILLDLYQTGAVPNCPAFATFVLKETANTCRELVFSIPPGSDPTLVSVPCGVSECYRECQICYNNQIPIGPCDDEARRLTIQCRPVPQQPPCTQIPSSCTQVDCFSE